VEFGAPLKTANTQRWRHALAPWGVRPSRSGPVAAGAAHRPSLAAKGAEPTRSESRQRDTKPPSAASDSVHLQLSSPPVADPQRLGRPRLRAASLAQRGNRRGPSSRLWRPQYSFLTRCLESPGGL